MPLALQKHNFCCEEHAMRIVSLTLIIVFAAASAPALSQGKRGRGPKDYWRAQTYANVEPAAQAKVVRLLTSPLGDLDGVLLDSGTIVTFPAHMSDQLAAAVKPGDVVVVKGYREAPSQIKGYVITNAAGNQSVTTLPKPRGGIRMPKFFRTLGMKEMNAEGEVRHLRFGKRGEPNGAILADGTIIRFKREALYRFAGLLQIGQRVSATGYGSENQFGRAFEATAIGAAGQPLQPLYRR
jgi:hypothetical protein